MKDEVPGDGLRALLSSRGPDHEAHHVVHLFIHSHPYFLVFYASVLHVRGKRLFPQPVVSQETGNILLFNGEVFDWDDGCDSTHHLDEDDDDGNDGDGSCLRDESDTQSLFNRLQELDDEEDGDAVTASFLRVISRIKGPFALIFYRQKEQELWFGRDCLGRRSLCFAKDPNSSEFRISSVCDPDASQDWCDVPANGLYLIKLPLLIPPNTRTTGSPVGTEDAITLFAWDRSPSGGCPDQHDLPFKLPHMRVKAAIHSPITCSLNAETRDDCTTTCTPVTNDVMSESGMRKSCSRQRQRNPNHHHDQAPADHQAERGEQMTSGGLLVANEVRQLEQVMDLSVRRRVRLYHRLCDDCRESRVHPSLRRNMDSNEAPHLYPNDGTISLPEDLDQESGVCDHASIAVLFSGGIDCTVITLLADRHVPKHQAMDLINVSFAPSSPDRLTSKSALVELRRLCPNRTFQLVHVDIEKEELIHWRRELIRKLLYPSCSVLDDSTGCAFFFASRGVGYLLDEETGVRTSYRSPARVLLNGLGSDEQLAGYSRHRRIFHTEGLEALNEEIIRELDQLHRRNLGRDDRIVSHNRREVRYPFLDEDVISFLNGLPIEKKCDLSLERGVGEKKLLRELAMKLGLEETSSREKRAIQFGSRIAKLEDHKEKGDMICSRLTIKS